MSDCLYAQYKLGRYEKVQDIPVTPYRVYPKFHTVPLGSYNACLPDVPLLALQRVEELRPEAGEPRVADVEVDARGHGHGEEERL